MEYYKYWIYEDYFIFKPEFNDELNIYQNQLVNYKKLIFSNYDDYKICIETNNEFENKYIYNYKVSKFNQSLANSLDKLINLQQLTLSHGFKQKSEIPFNVHILNLNCDNQYFIDNLPNSIIEL